MLSVKAENGTCRSVASKSGCAANHVVVTRPSDMWYTQVWSMGDTYGEPHEKITAQASADVCGWQVPQYINERRKTKH